VLPLPCQGVYLLASVTQGLSFAVSFAQDLACRVLHPHQLWGKDEALWKVTMKTHFVEDCCSQEAMNLFKKNLWEPNGWEGVNNCQ